MESAHSSMQQQSQGQPAAYPTESSNNPYIQQQQVPPDFDYKTAPHQMYGSPYPPTGYPQSNGPGGMMQPPPADYGAARYSLGGGGGGVGKPPSSSSQPQAPLLNQMLQSGGGSAGPQQQTYPSSSYEQWSQNPRGQSPASSQYQQSQHQQWYHQQQRAAQQQQMYQSSTMRMGQPQRMPYMSQQAYYAQHQQQAYAQRFQASSFQATGGQLGPDGQPLQPHEQMQSQRPMEPIGMDADASKQPEMKPPNDSSQPISQPPEKEKKPRKRKTEAEKRAKAAAAAQPPLPQPQQPGEPLQSTAVEQLRGEDERAPNRSPFRPPEGPSIGPNASPYGAAPPRYAAQYPPPQPQRMPHQMPPNSAQNRSISTYDPAFHGPPGQYAAYQQHPAYPPSQYPPGGYGYPQTSQSAGGAPQQMDQARMPPPQMRPSMAPPPPQQQQRQAPPLTSQGGGYYQGGAGPPPRVFPGQNPPGMQPPDQYMGGIQQAQHMTMPQQMQQRMSPEKSVERQQQPTQEQMQQQRQQQQQMHQQAPPPSNLDKMKAMGPPAAPPSEQPKTPGQSMESTTGGVPHSAVAPPLSPSASSHSQHDEFDDISNPSWPGTPNPKTTMSGQSEAILRMYDMGNEPGRRQFLESLSQFLEDANISLNHVPSVNKRPLDFYVMYTAVRERGGFEAVTKQKKWKEVSHLLDLNTTASGAYTIRKNYTKFLLPYECKYDMNNISPEVVLANVKNPPSLGTGRVRDHKSHNDSFGSPVRDQYGQPYPSGMQPSPYGMPSQPMDMYGQPTPYQQYPQQPPYGYGRGYPPQSGYYQQPPGMVPGPQAAYGYQAAPPQMMNGPGGPMNGSAAAEHYYPPMNGGAPQPPHPGMYPPAAAPGYSGAMSQTHPAQQQSATPVTSTSSSSPPETIPTAVTTSAPPASGSHYHPQHKAFSQPAQQQSYNNQPPQQSPFNQSEQPTPPNQQQPSQQVLSQSQQPPYGQAAPQQQSPAAVSSNQPPPPTSQQPPNEKPPGPASESDESSLTGPVTPSSQNDAKSRPPSQPPPPQQAPPRSQQPQQQLPDEPPGLQPSQLPPAQYPNSSFQRYPPHPQGVIHPQSHSQQGHSHPHQYAPHQYPHRDFREPFREGYPSAPSKEYVQHMNGMMQRPYGGSPVPSHQMYRPPYMSSPAVSRDARASPHYAVPSPHPGAYRQAPSPLVSQPLPPLFPGAHAQHHPPSHSKSRHHDQQHQMAVAMHHHHQQQQQQQQFAAPPIIKRQEYFPPGSIEASHPRLRRVPRLTSKTIGPVDMWRLMLSLRSGLAVEMTIALDTLAVITKDTDSLAHISLPALPGLLETLTETFRRTLMEIFPEFADLERPIDSPNPLRPSSESATARAHACEDILMQLGKNLVRGKGVTNGLKNGLTKIAVQPLVSDEDELKKPLRYDNSNFWMLDRLLISMEDREQQTIDGALWKSGRGYSTDHLQLKMRRKRRGMEKFFGERMAREIRAKKPLFDAAEPDGPPDLTADDESVDENANDVTKPESVSEKRPHVKSESEDEPAMKRECPDEKTISLESHTSECQSIPGATSTPERTNSPTDATDSKSDCKTPVKVEPLSAVKPDFAPLSELEATKRKPLTSHLIENLSLKQRLVEMNEWHDELAHDIGTALNSTDSSVQFLADRCICISNIIRNLSFLPDNEASLCAHAGLMLIVGRLIKLRLRRAKPTLSDEDAAVKESDDIEAPCDLERAPDPDDAAPVLDSADSEVAKLSASTAKSDPEMPSLETDNEAKELPHLDSKPPFMSPMVEPRRTVCDTPPPPPESPIDEPWMDDLLWLLRENALVTLSNVGGKLRLVEHENETCDSILGGLLYWLTSPSTLAADRFQKLAPTSPISPQRLALEALCRMTVQEGNADLMLTAQPFETVVRLFGVLTRMFASDRDQAVREFALVLISSLVLVDPVAARLFALQRPNPVGLLLTLLEFAEQNATHVVTRDGIDRLRDKPDLMGTTLDMLFRAAHTILRMAQIADNYAMFTRFEERMLNITMSQLMDRRVATTVADALCEYSKFSVPEYSKLDPDLIALTGSESADCSNDADAVEPTPCKMFKLEVDALQAVANSRRLMGAKSN